MQFPILFSNPVDAAVSWDEAGRPSLENMTPIYRRNVVDPRIVGTAAVLWLVPMHVDLILVDGVESSLGGSKEGWVNDDSALNPATCEGERIQDLTLAYGVDPDLPEKIRRVVDAYGRDDPPSCQTVFGEDLVRGCRVKDAMQEAFDTWSKEIDPHTWGAIITSWKDGSEVRRLPDLIYYRGPWIRSTARIAGEKLYYPALSNGRVVEHELFSPCRIADEEPAQYKERLADLQVRVAAAREAALTAPIIPVMPSRITRDRKPPPQRLPPQVEVGHASTSRAAQGSVDRAYDCECAMLAALGYRQIGGTQSRTGRSRSSTWVLPGAVGVEQLVPEALRIDARRGEIIVPKDKVGVVIGSGGSRIKKICELTKRRWKVLGV